MSISTSSLPVGSLPLVFGLAACSDEIIITPVTTEQIAQAQIQQKIATKQYAPYFLDVAENPETYWRVNASVSYLTHRHNHFASEGFNYTVTSHCNKGLVVYDNGNVIIIPAHTTYEERFHDCQALMTSYQDWSDSWRDTCALTAPSVDMIEGATAAYELACGPLPTETIATTNTVGVFDERNWPRLNNLRHTFDETSLEAKIGLGATTLAAFALVRSLSGSSDENDVTDDTAETMAKKLLSSHDATRDKALADLRKLIGKNGGAGDATPADDVLNKLDINHLAVELVTYVELRFSLFRRKKDATLITAMKALEMLAEKYPDRIRIQSDIRAAAKERTTWLWNSGKVRKYANNLLQALAN